MHYEEQLVMHKQNSKMVWKTLNQILNNKPSKNSKIAKSFVGNNSTGIIDDSIDIANKFNDYFVKIGPNFANQINVNDHETFEKFLSGSYQSSFSVDVITENELEAELENISSNKSSGYDEVSPKIIKTIGKEISKPLTHIFNLSFSFGIIPTSLKIALVTPIFKGNKQNRFENYRPISVLSCFSKLLEKLLTKRLTHFIEAKQIKYYHSISMSLDKTDQRNML